MAIPRRLLTDMPVLFAPVALAQPDKNYTTCELARKLKGRMAP